MFDDVVAVLVVAVPIVQVIHVVAMLDRLATVTLGVHVAVVGVHGLLGVTFGVMDVVEVVAMLDGLAAVVRNVLMVGRDRVIGHFSSRDRTVHPNPPPAIRGGVKGESRPVSLVSSVTAWQPCIGSGLPPLPRQRSTTAAIARLGGVEPYRSVRPSMHSRSRSACPMCWAYSEIMWPTTARTDICPLPVARTSSSEIVASAASASRHSSTSRA